MTPRHEAATDRDGGDTADGAETIVAPQAPIAAQANSAGLALGQCLDLLDLDADELLSFGTRPIGGRFSASQRTVADLRRLDCADLDGHDVWCGLQPMRQATTRGTAEDVVRLVALFADLDVGTGKMPTDPACVEVVRALSGMLGTAPAYVVASGHGYQPVWSIERDLETTDMPAMRQLLRRWGALVQQVAVTHGGHADSVFDAARVLRVPGTVNWKDPEHPVPAAAMATGGAPVSVEQIREALDAYLIDDPEDLPDDQEPFPDVEQPEHTCGYARAMISGWSQDLPDARHPWATRNGLKLAALRRLGCITDDDFRAGIDALADRMQWLLAHHGTPRPFDRVEILGKPDSIIDSALRKAAGYSEQRLRRTVGDHEHRDLEDLVQPAANIPPRHDPQARPMPLEEARAVFRKWLGGTYDTDAMEAALATIAVERLDGDPVWLLLISGSGNAKTETVVACGVGAVAVSTVSGEAALLSASPKRSRAKDATGGLLRQLEPRGVLVVKDVTSILSMDRTARQEVLAALREIHDGHWDRPVGTDGGKTLSWAGRIAVLGAVTTAWDSAHAVIATMGDRFVLLRMDSTVHRAAAGRQAISNTGHEEQMRSELAAAAAGVIAGMAHDVGPVTEAEADRIMRAADLVTRARTGVDFDYRGDVINAHAPEMPTRFAKELTQILRGAVAIGLDREQALRLAIRCARDSMPPIRLAIIDDLAGNPHATPTQVRKRLGKPRATVDRQMQALHMLGVCELDEIEMSNGKTQWHYSLAPDVDPTCLSITRNVEESGECGEKREEVTLSAARSPDLNKSGTAPPRDESGPF